MKHVGKECFKGSENGYGCPWYEFPQNLNRNAYCGLCMECVKTCPLDNIALNLRKLIKEEGVENIQHTRNELKDKSIF
ncbi:MAG: hypothetical protein QW470_07415 [Candidatus Caldarchaeum sp.]